MNESKNNPTALAIQGQENLKPILQVLSEEQGQVISSLKEELKDNWNKRQIFRTETEMRISVLNDAKHPTEASKYWQSVREMGAMFDALMGLSFDIRRNDINRRKIEKKLEKATDELKIQQLEVDLDQNLYERAHMEQTAKDRVRELTLWSKIKDELDTGEFDTQNVNSHQAESYRLTLGNRVKALGPHAGPAEVINAAGPLSTVERLKTQDGKLLNFKEARDVHHQLSAGSQNKQLEAPEEAK